MTAAHTNSSDSSSDSVSVGQRNARTVRTRRMRSPEDPILVVWVPVDVRSVEAAMVGNWWEELAGWCGGGCGEEEEEVMRRWWWWVVVVVVVVVVVQ